MQIGDRYNPYKLFHGAFIPNWLLQRSDISPGAKLLFARLAQFAGEDGRAWPSQEALGKEIGVSDRQVRTYLHELLLAQIIEGERRGLTQTNRYYFLWTLNADQDRKESSVPERKDPSYQKWKDPSDKENHRRESIEENHNTYTYEVPEELKSCHEALLEIPEYKPTQSFFTSLLKYTAAVDLQEEAVKAKAWWETNHTRKRYKSFVLFFLNWLKNTKESGNDRPTNYRTQAPQRTRTEAYAALADY